MGFQRVFSAEVSPDPFPAGADRFSRYTICALQQGREFGGSNAAFAELPDRSPLFEQFLHRGMRRRRQIYPARRFAEMRSPVPLGNSPGFRVRLSLCQWMWCRIHFTAPCHQNTRHAN